MIFIFDLGNVVVKIDQQKIIDYWKTVIGDSACDAVNGFEVDEEYEKYEKGQIDSVEYWKHFCKVCNCKLGFDDFNYGWCALYGGYMPGILETINALSEKNRVIALTNTNNLHVNVWVRLYPEICDIFDKVYLSSEIGFRKPEKGCFEYVLKMENGSPDEVIFFDDNLENVSGAESLGIRGVHVQNDDTVRKYLSGKWI
ncbi:HAD-IA family hydrolase [Thermodesulfobacteriota bacterium]